MKRISIPFYLISLLALTLSGCSYNCACDENTPERRTTQISRLIPEGQQLLDECSFIDEEITESKSFAKKMAKSRYAMHYLAMSRERISSLQARAKQIGCQ
ncbi:hypothetical protein ACFL3P_04800 [Pseudomonadota bacterium]